MLFMVAAPFLLATGVISVTWSNGLPSISFNRDRAVVVGQQLEQQVEVEAWRATQQMRTPQGGIQMPPPQSAQQFQPAYR
jgi:hypothetical protein